MKTKKRTSLKDVFSGSPWEAEIVKSLLESNGITPVLQAGNLGTIIPYFNDTIVLVSEEDYKPAITIIRDRDVSM
jgi:hypothetical protein